MKTDVWACNRALAALASIVLFLALTPAIAQDSGFHADTDPAALASIEKFEIDLCALLVRGDWRAYAANVADDYVRVLAGKVQTKAEVLQEFRTSKAKTLAMIPEKMDTRIFGNTAVMNINLLVRRGAPDGTVTEDRGRLTKVFIRRDGKWYLAQLTSGSAFK
jgi:ketosteroid isomerase-like protein